MVDSPWDFTGIGDVIATYSGGPSLAGVPAGGRAEGAEFEQAVAAAWTIFAEQIQAVAVVRIVHPARSGQTPAVKLESRNGPWAIYWNYSEDLARMARHDPVREDLPPGWLERHFLVSDLLEVHLGPGPYPFAPKTPTDSKLYSGENYPALFAGRSTNFDFSGALVEEGVLKEKLLFEYKYAKSSGTGGFIDGNAHERLAFQVLQYVEIAMRFPSCSLNVIAAQAFSEYRNKYHPAFNQQAARLNETFQQVQFRFAACRSEYIALFDCFARFLHDGSLPPVDYRNAG